MHPSTPETATRPKDAQATRRALIHAARVRFARDGYPGTVVRDIAADAGVNVALINRYFGSKEGLFEACLEITTGELGARLAGLPDVERMIRVIQGSITAGDEDLALQLLLLVRSSGEETVDGIRRDTLRRYSEKIASVAAGDAVVDEAAVLRAQVAVATVLGIVVLRSSTALEPLGSATEDELEAPLGAALRALLA